METGIRSKFGPRKKYTEKKKPAALNGALVSGTQTGVPWGGTDEEAQSAEWELEELVHSRPGEGTESVGWEETPGILTRWNRTRL